MHREIYYLSNGTLFIKIGNIVWEIHVFTHIVKASRHFSKWWANAKNVKVAPTLNCHFNMSKMNCNHKKRSPLNGARTLVSRPDYREWLLDFERIADKENWTSSFRLHRPFSNCKTVQGIGIRI